MGRRSTRLRGAVVAIASTMLVGCGGTIFRTMDFNDGQSVILDARQRAIANLTIKETSPPGQIHPRRVLCAEPSPDVALAVAHSLSAGLGVFGYGSGTLTQGVAEGIAQLAERGATVQLLRDVLYRACEAYANGAISSTTYAMMMARLDETTVTLLLGELAAGAFGRQLAGLGGTAEGKAVSELTQALKQAVQKARAGSAAGGSAPAESGSDSEKAKAESEIKAITTALAEVGKISGRAHTAEIAHEVVRIHRSFMDDPNLDALMVACITALGQEHARPAAGDRPGTLAHLCEKEVFAELVKKVPVFLKARAEAEALVREASNRRVYADAVAKCFEAQAKSDRKDMCDKLVEILAISVPALQPPQLGR